MYNYLTAAGAHAYETSLAGQPCVASITRAKVSVVMDATLLDNYSFAINGSETDSANLKRIANIFTIIRSLL